MTHAERPLSELLAELSARSPAPGGGCAAAWSGALAAALLEMVASFADDQRSAERATALRTELLAAGERELRSYLPVLAAQALPKSDPSRQERFQAAVSDASEAPLAIARACAEVAELAAAVAARSGSALRADAAASGLLAEAACQAAGRIVQVNLAGLDADSRLTEITDLMARAATARESVLGLG
jgi:formiminotetrahydrofolate cyclodeaminase